MLSLLLNVFDVMSGVRAVPDLHKSYGVGGGGRGTLLENSGVDQGNIRSVLSPIRMLKARGAKGCWEGLSDPFGQVSCCAGIHDSSVASKKSSIDALPDGLDSSIMPSNVVSQEGLTSCQNVAGPVLTASANGAQVVSGGVSGGGVWHLPPVGKFFVPKSPPSGFMDLHFEGPGDCGGCPEVVAGLWKDLGEGSKPHSGIDACEVRLGSVK